MTSEEEFLKNLGQKIRHLRKEKGLSLNNISEQSGFEKARLSRLEAGKVNITVKTLFKLSHALDVPVHKFFA
jgi:transcriptional regulator with XRE-family HTH domain